MKLGEEPQAFFKRIKEVSKEYKGEGFWRSCSGCHETEDGYDIGFYPFNEAFGCKLGGGCSECGGIGAVWDMVDYAELARYMNNVE